MRIDQALKAIGANHLGRWYMPYTNAGIEMYGSSLTAESDDFIVIGEIKHWLLGRGWDFFTLTYQQSGVYVGASKGWQDDDPTEVESDRMPTEIEAWCDLVEKVVEAESASQHTVQTEPKGADE